jgi:hypothetical protein
MRSNTNGDLQGLLGARRAHEVVVQDVVKCRPGRLDMNPYPGDLGYKCIRSTGILRVNR